MVRSGSAQMSARWCTPPPVDLDRSSCRYFPRSSARRRDRAARSGSRVAMDESSREAAGNEHRLRGKDLQRKTMHIGVSLRSGYGPMDARIGARWMTERARAAAAAGLDSLFVGDHHNVPVPYYQNVPMLGRLLAEWDERPAGALFLLPLWHPVLVAEQIGTLASIAAGPFVMQCALGGGAEQFEALGASLRTRPSRFEAALSVIRRLCAGEAVSMDAPYAIPKAQIAPVPTEPLEVWIGGAAAPAVDRA